MLQYSFIFEVNIRMSESVLYLNKPIISTQKNFKQKQSLLMSNIQKLTKERNSKLKDLFNQNTLRN